MRHVLALTIGLTIGVAATVLAADFPSAVVTPYLKIQTALAGDSFDAVRQNAQIMAAAVAALEPKANGLGDAARLLERAGGIDEARVAFAVVTNALLQHSKAIGAALPSGVRVAYCPMKKHSWLQEGTEVRNPYYGSAMLSCGEFTDD